MILLPMYCFLVGCRTAIVSPTNLFDYGLIKQQRINLTTNIPELERQYYDPGTNDTRRLQIREQIVYQLLELDDEYYRKWISNFYGHGAAFNTIAETAAPTLSAAAAATTGGASTALALISTGIGALNTSVSKNFLQQAAITILTGRSDALRDAIRNQINNSMTNNITFGLSSSLNLPLQVGVLFFDCLSSVAFLFSGRRCLRILKLNAALIADLFRWAWPRLLIYGCHRHYECRYILD